MKETENMDIKENWSKIKNQRIHYLKAGEGNPIILLHGGSSTAHSAWKKNIESLAEIGEIYAIDLPGFGESDKPKLEYTTELFTQFLKEFIDKRELKNLTLIGNSMGGAIAFSLATELDEVNKLILVDSYGLSKKHRYLQKPVYLSLNIPYLIEEVGWRIQQIINKHWIEWAFFKWLKTDWGWKKIKTNIIDKKEKIDFPLLMIHGKKDKIISPKMAKKACEELKKCELKLIDKARHWPQREKPNEFNEIVKNFIE